VKLLNTLFFVGIGVLGSSMGYGVTTWQMWMMFVLVAGVDITSHISAKED